MSKRSKTDEGSLLSLFLSTPVGDHLPRGTTGDVPARKVGPVLVVRRTETLPRVFRKLIVEGFLSAPVLSGSRFVGFIDMMDLVEKTTDLFWGDSVEAWTTFWDKQQKFAETTIDDIMKVPSRWTRDPSPPLENNYTTFTALERMVRGNFHRLALVSPGTNNLLSGILTQSMLISWLRQNRAIHGTLSTMSVRSMISDVWETCRTISETDKAINAFKTMANEKLSGLAVIDSRGELTGAISIRDLRTVGSSGVYFQRLFRSVKEFKRLAREDHPRLAPTTHFSNRMLPRTGRMVTFDDTFETVITRMADGNIHRVFVCDSYDSPIPLHVINQVDVLRVVLDHIVGEAQNMDITG